jgi:hypothetical protein
MPDLPESGRRAENTVDSYYRFSTLIFVWLRLYSYWGFINFISSKFFILLESLPEEDASGGINIFNPFKLTEVCYNFYNFVLLTTWDMQCEHNSLTACLQTCYKMWDFFVYSMHATTHVTHKNAQVVTGLQTSCYKAVHKLSTSCVRTACSQLLEQVWNKLSTTCNKLDGIIRLVTRLF